MSEQTQTQQTEQTASEPKAETLSTVQKIKIYTEMCVAKKTNAQIAQRLGMKPASLSVWASNLRTKLKNEKGVDLPHPANSRKGSASLDDAANAVTGILGKLDAEDKGEANGEAVPDPADVEVELEAEATA